MIDPASNNKTFLNRVCETGMLTIAGAFVVALAVAFFAH